MSVTIEEIQSAQARIRGKVHQTPVMTSAVIDKLLDVSCFFKCEHLQKVGAFKARGATNAVYSLTDAEAAQGVVTHSSGNHAAALARAAALRGIPAYIVMPSNAPLAKQASVRRYGGHITLCEPTLEARERAAAEVQARTGAVFIHPYDDDRVIAGQGTVALELLEQVPDLDVILCPVGGGGLLSGVAIAAKALNPEIRVIAVEPAGADDAARSFATGRLILQTAPKTVADGLLTSLCDRTFAVIQVKVDEIVTVEEDGIIEAMRLIWEVLKQVVEPSGAVAFAGARANQASLQGLQVGIVLTGGNLDLDHLPWMTLHG